MSARQVIFILAFLGVLTLFLRRIYLLLAMVLLGQEERRLDRLKERLKALAVYGFGQRRVIEKPFGLDHFLLFWGFILLQLLVNMEFIINGVFPRFSLSFVGDGLYSAMGCLADVTSSVVLLVVIIALVRRSLFRPWYIESKAGAYFILLLVALLMIANLAVHAAAIATGQEHTQYLPVAGLLASSLGHSLSPAFWSLVAHVSWWLHGMVLLVFICYIPYSKHLHILTALANCFFRRLAFPNTLPPMVFRKGEVFGVSRVTQLSWKDLYDFLSCTECGRCAEGCPATSTGKVLNPMEVILAGKANLLSNGMELLRGRSFDSLERADVRVPLHLPLIGEDRLRSVRPEAIWDCTTCGACVERCPVFIEQFPKLLKMRRHLVMEKVDFPPELITLFENVEQRGNPYGIAPADRAGWADILNIPRIAGKTDGGYLLFAGCVPSFNPRMRPVLAAIAAILKEGAIPFAVLGREEPCCGDPLRRAGNEYVFERIVRANIELFVRSGVQKIITLCPHCYNTFKNDYPAFGGAFEVLHHTKIIADLLGSGAFAIEGKAERTVVHDACYLGRYNAIFEEPRAIIRAATGSPPLEMDRARRESFCCGAGGGRLWMHESEGTRINTERTRQALLTDPAVIATSCPYCLMMFEDGLKDAGVQNRVRAMDVSELLATRMKKGGREG